MAVHEAQRAAPLGLNGSQDRVPAQRVDFAAVPPPLLATKLAIPSPAPSLVLPPASPPSGTLRALSSLHQRGRPKEKHRRV
jgi:hypothetical protein